MMRRGEIWWANLPEPIRSKPGYRRPVLIVQADSFNRSAIRTVVGVLLTGELRWAQAAGNVLLHAKDTGLPRDSVANVTQVFTMDRDSLSRRIGAIPQSLLDRVDQGLRLVLDL